MEIKQCIVIHIFMLIVGGRACSAVKQFIVTEGDTLVLKCLLKNSSENVHLEWRNPQGHVMFFNTHKALRDTRSYVFTLNDSEYTVHVSNVTLKDEGVYKCVQYEDKLIIKRYKVKVLGTPKIEMAKNGDKTIIQCSTESNGHPPELSWVLSGIEIEARPNTLWHYGSNRSVAVSVLKIKTHIRQATVKCLAKYQALPKPLENIITIGNDASTSSYFSTRDKLKTETMIKVTSAPVFSSTAHMELSSNSESNEVFSTEKSPKSDSTQEDISTATEISLITHSRNLSESNSTGGLQTKNGSSDSTQGFGVETEGEKDHRNAQNYSSPLLVLLVTCLILCLLIVVIFFVIRLRKAHIAWKKENEESDQSQESNKSKSSHEEKQSKERRRQGFWNSNFTEYRVEETPQNEAKSNATVDVITETQDSSRTACSTLEAACVKETEL
ncbi:cytotoxic and regulatory T-cell molecule-like isoform X2 [Myxocyprinus asiaticus]|uniref:cytotoxic and regulatory T-cell molecule-like isoform X2 n=1 Tax=Myxocyprinus asiaticus TaxID=70543 RepID=UPI002223E8EB|nr:cytotoxic and regulatory T-cell molecule-like isoform X2 [Myxocyprinus asiaticus]